MSGAVITKTMTRRQIRAELRRLERHLGMSTDRAEVLDTAGVLDADRRRTLRRIHDLRWLVE